MIYLIVKIFGYLLVALLAGFASGWLFRNLVAVKKDEEQQSSLNDARSKLPQFESLLRGRDTQVNALKDDLEKKEQNICDLMDAAREKEQVLLKKTRELKRLTKQGLQDDDSIFEDADLETRSAETSAEMPSIDEGEVAQARGAQTEALKIQIADLEKELEQAVQARLQAEAGALANTTDADRDSNQVRELEARLRQQARDFERLSKSVEQERRKVVELERERELQHRSLQVLHQQLELERDRVERRSNG